MLGTEAQSLVAAGREWQRPALTDRQRVLEQLRQRIGGGSPIVVSMVVPKAGVRGLAQQAQKLALATAAACVVATATWHVLHRDPAGRGVEPTRQAPVATAVAATTPEPAPAPTVADPGTDSSATDPAPSKADRSRANQLGEEVALLSRAETDLHARRWSEALTRLDEHARRFPRGTLTQERIAAQVQALCGLGRTADAESALARLRSVSPNSLHEARARAACAPYASR